MGHTTCKRTLKKRIRRVLSVTVFITVFLFSTLIIFITAQAFRAQASIVSAYVSNSLAATMNSDFFKNQMGIKGLEDFNPKGQKEIQWLESLQKNEDFATDIFRMHNKNKKDPNKDKDYSVKFDDGNPNTRMTLPFMDSGDMVLNTIVLNGKVIYKTLPNKNSPPPVNTTASPKPTVTPADPKPTVAPVSPKPTVIPLSPDPAGTPVRTAASVKANSKDSVEQLKMFFSFSKVSCNLLDSKGAIIGTVTTTIDSNFLVFIYILLAGLIVLAGLFSIFIANIIGKLLSLSVTTPIMNLDEKISMLANEDFSNGRNKQIILKKPLKEIESLANSTNQIMSKMEQYNHLLEEQKITLGFQNEELEAQNEELLESKRKIEDAQAMLVQSENMASIGQLTAAITHEINTPLGAINSNVQLYDMLIKLLEDSSLLKSDTELLDIVEKMKETNSVNLLACQRVIEIIKSLKTFSKLDQAEFQEVNITEGIKSVLVLTSNLWKNKIKVHEEYGVIPMVKCYPGLLNQVFMNIVVNAIQAVETKGDIFIKTYADNEFINISIRDTGIGIKEENLPRIFEAGFSTKETGIGAGLGLSICTNIMQKHNGKIEVNSSSGNGSEFIIKVPIIN